MQDADSVCLCDAQLFDASIVANKAHAAAWHGWGLLEKRQGNLMKAKDLWLKVQLAHA